MKFSNINDYRFFKNKDLGYLYNEDKKANKTEEFFNLNSNIQKEFEGSKKNVNERLRVSYIDKIFNKGENFKFDRNKIITDEEKFYNFFVEFIYYHNIDKAVSKLKTYFKILSKLDKILNNHLASFSKKLVLIDNGQKLGLKECIKLVYNDESKAKILLKEIYKIIEEKIKKRKNNVKKSIKNNKFLFTIDNNNEIIYNTEKSKLLNILKKEIINNGLINSFKNFMNKVKKVEEKFNIEKFVKECKSKQNNLKNKNNFIYFLFGYKKELHDNLPDDEIKEFLEKIYIDTVEKYFLNFIRNKKTSNDLDENTAKNSIRGIIKNLITQFMIREGKIIKKYGLEFDQNQISNSKINWDKKEFNTDDLVIIASEEALTRKIIESCVFATNNLANILKHTNFEKDLLTKDNLSKLLDNMKSIDIETKELTKMFYNIEGLENMPDNKFRDLIWAIRGSIQSIRNNVYHCSKNAYNEIFNVIEYESINNNNEKYVANIYLKNLFEKEKKEFRNAIIQKLISMKIFDFFSIDLLKKVFEKITIDEFEQNENLPSFNKMIERGKNIVSNFLNIKVDSIFSKETDQDLAIMNLFKIIYEYDFKNKFLSNPVEFKTAVIGASNRKISTLNNFPNANIDILNEFSGTTKEDIKDYLFKLQSKITLQAIEKEEKHKKEKNKKDKEDEKNVYFSFLLDITAFGFDSYIKNMFKNIDFKTTETENKEFNADFLTISIPVINTEDKNISFFTFAKLLNNELLNELQQKLIKFQKNDGFKDQINILQLCKITNDNCVNCSQQSYDKIVEKFVDKDVLKEKLEPYYNNKTDLVFFKELYLLKKYGTLRIIEYNFHNCKITKDDVKKFLEKKKDIKNVIDERNKLHEEILEKDRELSEKSREYYHLVKKINANNNLKNETLTDKRDKLHDELLKEKKKLADKLCEYKKLVNEINAYNNLKNKIYFTQIYNIHKLIMKVLSKPINFVSLWEKNFVNLFYSYFYEFIVDKNVNKLKKEKSFEAISTIENEGTQNFREIANEKNNGTIIFPDLRNCFNNLYNYNLDINYNWKTIRENFAHLQLLQNNKVELTTIINDLRNLLSFDRNIKNTITPAFIKLFDQNNLAISLKFQSLNKSICGQIISKKITHFEKVKNIPKEDKIITNFYEAEFLQKIKNIFNLI